MRHPCHAYQEQMKHVAIVLDANILIRAVLGKRVRELIQAHAGSVQFFAPDVAYADARKYLPALLEIWTEDADFFGTGVATWTSDRVALYLANA